MDEEGRLRRAFARLREEERRATPSFDRVMTRRQAQRRPADRRRRVSVLGLAGAAAVILLLAVAGPRLGRFLAPGGDTGTLAAELQRTSIIWRSPTDFLLERPFADTWRGIPAIGRPARWPVAEHLAPDGRTDEVDLEDPGRTPS